MQRFCFWNALPNHLLRWYIVRSRESSDPRSPKPRDSWRQCRGQAGRWTCGSCYGNCVVPLQRPRGDLLQETLGISRLRIGARSIFFITCGRRTNYKQSCMKVTRTVTAKQQRPTRRCMFTQSTSTSSSSLYTSKQELSPTLFSSVPTDRPKGAPPSLSV